jgi:hypothetical protein
MHLYFKLYTSKDLKSQFLLKDIVVVSEAYK